MKRAPWCMVLVLFLLGVATYARADSPRVILLTMGPGDDLFARFGHAAFYVTNGQSEVVYNFGYTNFNNPLLIFSFLRGRANFWVARSTYAATLDYYRREDRDVVQQTLNLSQAQQLQLARLLVHNALPAHRTYVYHHFNDNCSTRLRDLLDQVTQGAVREQLHQRPTGLSLRDLVRQGFAGRLSIVMLAELLLGRFVDRPIDQWQGSFLPHILQQALPQVKLPSGKPLASAPLPLYRRSKPDPTAFGIDPPDNGTSPPDPYAGVHLLWCAAGASILIALLMGRGFRRRRRWAGLLLLLLTTFCGLCGLLLWGLAVISTLPELRQNELLLLFWPLDLALVLLAVRWLRGRFYVGRLLQCYIGLRLGVVAILAAAHLGGILYQQPMIWFVFVLALQGGLVLAVLRPPPPREE